MTDGDAAAVDAAAAAELTMSPEPEKDGNV